MNFEAGVDPVISFIDVTFRYDDRRTCLDHISFDIHRGERVALIGANGSGKSTLAMMMNALRIPSQGVCLILGYDTANFNDHTSIRKKVGILFQDPDDMIVGTTVDREVAFGLENLCIETLDMRKKVNKLLDLVGLSISKNKGIWQLSGGEKQRLALASVLVMEPEILILDEPTSMLDVFARDKFERYIDQLNSAGTTIIYITHNEDVIQKCGRIIELSNGKIIRDDVHRYDKEKVSENIYTDEVSNIVHLPPKITNTLDEYGNTILKCDNISYSYEIQNVRKFAISGVSVEIKAGLVLSIIGSSGSGKSTLATCMSMLTLPDSGLVSYCGRVIKNEHDIIDIRKNIGYVMQYPETQFFAEVVFDEIAFFARNYGVAGQELETSVQSACNMVGLDRSILKRSPFELSGGEQRRVAIASALVNSPKLLILDEPHAGLDKCGYRDLNALIKKIRGQGTGVALITHDLKYAIHNSDTILLLESGKTEYYGDAIGAVEYMINDTDHKWPISNI